MSEHSQDTDNASEITPLDRAHGLMMAAPDDDGLRLRFYERLADGELFVLLTAEAQGDHINPRVFDLDEGRFIAVFDREKRLADFADAIVPFAALSGRVLVDMLRGQGLGLGLNLGDAPSAMLIPAEAVDWLAGVLEQSVDEMDATPESLSAPRGLPENLITALDAKLAIAGGLARQAYLVGVDYAAGNAGARGKGHLLVFVDNVPGSDGALTQLVREALVFSGLEAGTLDVAFFAASNPVCATLARVGLRFDLPAPPKPEAVGVKAPGMDPEKPPILR